MKNIKKTTNIQLCVIIIALFLPFLINIIKYFQSLQNSSMLSVIAGVIISILGAIWSIVASPYFTGLIFISLIIFGVITTHSIRGLAKKKNIDELVSLQNKVIIGLLIIATVINTEMTSHLVNKGVLLLVIEGITFTGLMVIRSKKSIKKRNL